MRSSSSQLKRKPRKRGTTPNADVRSDQLLHVFQLKWWLLVRKQVLSVGWHWIADILRDFAHDRFRQSWATKCSRDLTRVRCSSWTLQLSHPRQCLQNVPKLAVTPIQRVDDSDTSLSRLVRPADDRPTNMNISGKTFLRKWRFQILRIDSSHLPRALWAFCLYATTDSSYLCCLWYWADDVQRHHGRD